MPSSRFTEFSPTGRPKVPRLSMTTEPISWPPMTQTKKQECACDRGNYQATSNIENTDHTCQIYPPGHAAQRPEIDFAAVTANEDKCDSDQAGQTDCHGSGAIRASDCAGQNGIQKRLNGDERSKKDRCRQVRNRYSNHVRSGNCSSTDAAVFGMGRTCAMPRGHFDISRCMIDSEHVSPHSISRFG